MFSLFQALHNDWDINQTLKLYERLNMLGVSKERKKDEKMNGIFYNLMSWKYYLLVYHTKIRDKSEYKFIWFKMCSYRNYHKHALIWRSNILWFKLILKKLLHCPPRPLNLNRLFIYLRQRRGIVHTFFQSCYFSMKNEGFCIFLLPVCYFMNTSAETKRENTYYLIFYLHKSKLEG